MSDVMASSKLALILMDNTSLNEDDTPERITALVTSSQTAVGNTAAVCVYPRFVPVAREALSEQGVAGIRVATVANFPDGGSDIGHAVSEIAEAVRLGADEVDVVFPYRALMAGDVHIGSDLVRAAKQACGGGVLLKVILESGVLGDPALIRLASEVAISAGADFIKTSTGKMPVSATPEAARIMLQAIRDSGRDVGFKAAGGVRTAAEAREYLDIAADIMGQQWITPEHYRFGASSLLANLLWTLGLTHADQVTKGSKGY